MSALDMIKLKSANAFAGTNGHNLSFDVWKFNSRQVVNSVNGTKDTSTPELDYWTQRESIIRAIT